MVCMEEMNIVIYGKSHDVNKTLRYLWVNINQKPTHGLFKGKKWRYKSFAIINDNQGAE